MIGQTFQTETGRAGRVVTTDPNRANVRFADGRRQDYPLAVVAEWIRVSNLQSAGTIATYSTGE